MDRRTDTRKMMTAYNSLHSNRYNRREREREIISSGFTRTRYAVDSSDGPKHTDSSYGREVEVVQAHCILHRSNTTHNVHTHSRSHHCSCVILSILCPRFPRPHTVLIVQSVTYASIVQR